MRHCFSLWKHLSGRPGNRPTIPLVSCYLEGEASVLASGHCWQFMDMKPSSRYLILLGQRKQFSKHWKKSFKSLKGMFSFSWVGITTSNVNTRKAYTRMSIAYVYCYFWCISRLALLFLSCWKELSKATKSQIYKTSLFFEERQRHCLGQTGTTPFNA